MDWASDVGPGDARPDRRAPRWLRRDIGPARRERPGEPPEVEELNARSPALVVARRTARCSSAAENKGGALSLIEMSEQWYRVSRILSGTEDRSAGHHRVMVRGARVHTGGSSGPARTIRITLHSDYLPALEWATRNGAGRTYLSIARTGLERPIVAAVLYVDRTDRGALIGGCLDKEVNRPLSRTRPDWQATLACLPGTPPDRAPAQFEGR